MSFSIDGKTAIVTGAANGIGLAIARHFVEQGANVVFADMDEKRLKKEIEDIAEQENVTYFAGDLRERLTVANLLSATVDAFDQIDILVNASRQVIPTDAFDHKDSSIETLFEQNVLTALRLSQAVAKRMKQQVEVRDDECIGTIVNLSSLAAQRAQPELLGYSVSTAALDQMTRSLALAYAGSGIRVNAVAFASLMSASLQATLKENPDMRKDIEEHTPIRWIASANEIVDTVQYLASDASRFVTGQVVTVDGGRGLLDAVSAPAH